MSGRKRKRVTISAEEIAGAIGVALPAGACKVCGGCGWMTSSAGDYPCKCNTAAISNLTAWSGVRFGRERSGLQVVEAALREASKARASLRVI